MPRSTYQFGTFSLDLAEQRLLDDGRPVPLTPKVFDVLRVLVENAGHLVEKEQVLREVWNDAFVEEASLSRAISVLRKALRESDSNRYIETVPKRGYRFVAPVSERATAPPREASARPDRVPSSRAAVLAAAIALFTVAAAYRMFNGQEMSHEAVTARASLHRQLTFTGNETSPTLSPDGKFIAYVSKDGRHRRVVVQEVDGGARVEVFTAPEASALRWSPDGSELVFWARGRGLDGTYIASRSGGGARKVGDGWFVTCWSPDGSALAFALFGSQKIRFINRLGEHLRTISLEESRDWIFDLDWSPRHDRLLLVATDANRRAAIWSIRPDGADQTKILSWPHEISAARWSPSGDAIYYFSRVHQTVSVFKTPVASGAVVSPETASPLISGIEGDGSYGLSGDARRLVYARAPYHSNLWLVEADRAGTEPASTRQLTYGTSVVERPRVSPDGETILFNMGHESRANLFIMPAAGGQPRQLTFMNAFSVGGVWSPDGRAVAFASTEGGKLRIWVTGSDGGSPRPLPASELSENLNLSWSPGARLLYQSPGYRNLYAVDPETWAQDLLWRDGDRGFVASPEYSPDGRQIAFYWSRAPLGLWTSDAQGANAKSILHVPQQSESNPFPIGWSSDGRSIYAYDGRRAAARGLSVAFGETVTAARIVRIPVDGGPAATVLNLPFDEVGGVAMFPDARRFVVSVYSSRSDVWVVENFDAARTPDVTLLGPLPIGLSPE
jgi:Tol biopolymer transport system component/DNA-binding winged helix-turn-helix (wHTH) protein